MRVIIREAVPTGMALERWHRLIEALRSEKFKQGSGLLRRTHEGAFCCVGVACELVREKVKGTWHGAAFEVGNQASSYTAVPAVAAVYGQPAVDGVEYDELFNRMISWNDEASLTFPQIADLLDHWLKTGELL